MVLMRGNSLENFIVFSNSYLIVTYVFPVTFLLQSEVILQNMLRNIQSRTQRRDSRSIGYSEDEEMPVSDMNPWQPAQEPGLETSPPRRTATDEEKNM